jgi:hypothetical protein
MSKAEGVFMAHLQAVFRLGTSIQLAPKKVQNLMCSLALNSLTRTTGWAPSTFTSSRSARTTKKAATAEDFMDEEDLAEMRESRKLVDMNETMDILGGTAAEKQRRSQYSIEDEYVSFSTFVP